jgi:Cu/Ag efflux protein CusF
MSVSRRWSIGLTAVVVGAALASACGQGATKTEPAAQQPPAAQTAAAPQQTEKKEYVFRGKIEQIDAAGKRFTVNGQDVPGWMPAMTMIYAPDKPDVLDKVKVGDEITAKVFDGDFMTLHDVEIVH